MNITAVMAIYGRYDITIENIKRLKKQEPIKDIVVIGSTPEDKKLAKETSCIYKMMENKPLGKKWQKGIELAKKTKPDGVMIVGSDGLLSKGWTDYYSQFLNEFDLIGRSNSYIFNISTNELLFFQYTNAKRVLGSGRIVSSRILDEIEWKFFPHNINGGLDGKSTAILKKHGAKILVDNNENNMLVSLKGNYQTITPFSKLSRLKRSKVIEKKDYLGFIYNLKDKHSDLYKSITKIQKIVKKKEDMGFKI